MACRFSIIWLPPTVSICLLSTMGAGKLFPGPCNWWPAALDRNTINDSNAKGLTGRTVITPPLWKAAAI
jgi:hypothetical protein